MSDNIIIFPTLKLPVAMEDAELRGCVDPAVVESAATGSSRNASDVFATREMTPVIFPHPPIEEGEICGEQLGCHEILLVPVRPVSDASPTSFVENIAREMLSERGRPLFGWRIRTTPLYVVAEFYAMHQTEIGLVDVTPNTRGEHYVVFTPDHDVPPDFDYLDRPVTRRFSTYVTPTRQERVAAAIAMMEPDLLAFERRRAAAKGITEADMLSLKLGPDALETSLDLFIECSTELELLMMAVVDGREVMDLAKFDDLQRRKATLGALVEDAFARVRLGGSRKRPASRSLS